MSGGRKYTLVAFDVSADRTRYRVVKLLAARAVRVQESVFEARLLDEAAFLRLRSDIEGLLDEKTDRVLYLRTCAPCAAGVVFVGRRCQPPDSREDVEVV